MHRHDALKQTGFGHLSMVLSSPTRTSALYAIVFVSDLLLMSGLIVLALQHVIVEQNILAKLHMGPRLPNPARPLAAPQTSINGVSLADLT